MTRQAPTIRALNLGAIGTRKDSNYVRKAKFTCSRCGTPVGRPKHYVEGGNRFGLCKDCNSLRDPLIEKWRNEKP